jgi:HTH-like domain
MSERWACRVVNQPRGTQRFRPSPREDEDALTRAIVALASQYGRYGYRRITALLRGAGWQVGKDRVGRIWRREGLKVPQKQKPRGRLWLNDGSCVRLRPEQPNHVWGYDFVNARTHDGRTVRVLNLIDEHSREFLMIRPERRWSSAKVIEALDDVMVTKGDGAHPVRQRPGIRSQRSAQVAGRNRSQVAVHRAGFSMGERVLRELQLEAERVPQRRNLLLDEGDQGADRALARPLQHRQTTILAGIQTTGAGSVADLNRGAWRSGNRYALPTSPHPDCDGLTNSSVALH